MNQSDEPTQNCSNCDKPIPESKLPLHEAYCLRNVRRCPKCNLPIDKSEMGNHEAETHKLVKCKYCKQEHEASVLAGHEANCHARPILCKYCKCDVDPKEFVQHQDLCGSRTRRCEFCNQNITIKEDHEVICQLSQQHGEEAFPPQNLKKFRNAETEGRAATSNTGVNSLANLKRSLVTDKFRRTATMPTVEEDSPTKPNNFKSFNKKGEKKAEGAEKKKRLVKKSEAEGGKKDKKKKKDSDRGSAEEDSDYEIDGFVVPDEGEEEEEADDEGLFDDEVQGNSMDEGFVPRRDDNKNPRYPVRQTRGHDRPYRTHEPPKAPPSRLPRGGSDEYYQNDDDEELQRVLMESLMQHQGENQAGKPKDNKSKSFDNPVVIDDDEDEDEEFRKAIAASLENSKTADPDDFYLDHKSKGNSNKRK